MIGSLSKTHNYVHTMVQIYGAPTVRFQSGPLQMS